MQNLIDQVAKDKTDNKNKETLKRIQDKAAMMNAVSNEKRYKDEIAIIDKMERE